MISIESGSIIQDLDGFVLIPAGSFRMGAESAGWGETEYPAHEVSLSAFYLDIHHVSNKQFDAFVADTNYQTTAEKRGGGHGYRAGNFGFMSGLHWRHYATADRTNHPVVLVSWEDAQAYCNWAGKRLPTEAEWEYAARGGLVGQLYPWGNEEPTGQHCTMGRTTLEVPQTSVVMTHPANGFGLYDMAGNVWDLCADSYDPNCYAHSAASNPTCAVGGDLICRRGGAFNIIQAFRCRTANRGAFPRDGYAINVGFRCARTV